MWQRNLIFILGITALACSVSALNITNSTTSSQILWHWDACGDPSLIDNISVDGYDVCSFNMSLQDFLLVGLGPLETHVLNVTCSGENNLNYAKTNQNPYVTLPIPTAWQPPVMPGSKTNWTLENLIGYWWIVLIIIVVWLLSRRK
jgi:hypothetical protein